MDKAHEDGVQMEVRHLEVVLKVEHTLVHVLEAVQQVEKLQVEGNDLFLNITISSSSLVLS